MGVQFNDDREMREGRATGAKWLRVEGPPSQRVGEVLNVNVTIAGRQYALDGMVVEVTKRDVLVYITKASAGWTALATPLTR